MIYVFGDSHSNFIFGDLPGVKVEWLGPITMHRVGRDQAWFLKGRDIPSGSFVIFVFGEIDARCHVGRISEDSGKSRRQVVEDLVRRYLDAVQIYRSYRAIVVTLPPPADGPGIVNSDFPVYGAWRDRAEITEMINSELAVQTKRLGIGLLKIPAFYANRLGGLDPNLSDGSVHISQQFRWPILKELETVTDLEFQFSAAGVPTEAPPKSSPQSADQRPKNSEFQPAFELDSFGLQNESVVVESQPLTVLGPSQKWSYAISFPNLLPISSAAQWGAAEVSVEVTLLAGKLAIGLVQPDNKSFLVQVEIAEIGKRQHVKLVAPSLANVYAVIFRNADVEEPLKVAIHSITLDKRDPVEVAPVRGFGSKSAVEDVLRISAGKIGTVFDIGANVGDTTEAFLSTFTDAKIYAFEPHPAVAKMATERFASADRVEFINCALGATPTVLDLHCYTNPAINSLNPVSSVGASLMDGEVASTGTVQIQVDTVDRFMVNNDIAAVDLLKLDTQGFELEVLRGASSSFQSRKINFIIAELLFVPLYDNQSSFADVAQYLSSMGYDLVDFYDFVYGPDGQLKWGDGLFRLRSGSDSS